jgi:acetyltransferase-like isoleucine patch superfamily enzyme
MAIVALQTIVCAVSAFPSMLALTALLRAPGGVLARAAALSVAAVPAYVVFACLLLIVSPAAVRVARLHTPPDSEMRIADMEWRLLRWVQYMAAVHVVRLLAGSLFRATPLWTLYLRLNGARIGRRVYVNTLSITDHNLLTFGDDVVVGAQVHLSGHTVERGVVKTGRVALGQHVTVGLGSVVGIDVEVGPGCQIAALSLVPKHSRLDGHAVYAGIPAVRRDDLAPVALRRAH